MKIIRAVMVGLVVFVGATAAYAQDSDSTPSPIPLTSDTVVQDDYEYLMEAKIAAAEFRLARQAAVEKWYAGVAAAKKKAEEDAAAAAAAAEEAARQAEAQRAAAAASPRVVTGDVWGALAQCESGGTNANTGNGYYGYFQFALGTWQGLGAPGYPHEHSYATQLHYAQILQAEGGWGHWPACARKLGLL